MPDRLIYALRLVQDRPTHTQTNARQAHTHSDHARQAHMHSGTTHTHRSCRIMQDHPLAHTHSDQCKTASHTLRLILNRPTR